MPNTATITVVPTDAQRELEEAVLDFRRSIREFEHKVAQGIILEGVDAPTANANGNGSRPSHVEMTRAEAARALGLSYAQTRQLERETEGAFVGRQGHNVIVRLDVLEAAMQGAYE